jgi:ferredoxin
MRWRARPSAWGEARAPDVHRRGFLVALVSGLAAVPLIRLNGRLGTAWSPRLIRPPGSLPEKEFLARCIKCGQCMRVCPTNIVQPAGLEASVEGIWTRCLISASAPAAVSRLHRLRPALPDRGDSAFTLDEKLGRGAFAAAGRCAWAPLLLTGPLPAMGDGCAVHRLPGELPGQPEGDLCSRNGPDHRDGVRRVVRREADALQVEGARWPAAVLQAAIFNVSLEMVWRAGPADCRQHGGPADLDSAQSWELRRRPATRSRSRSGSAAVCGSGALHGCGICEHECPVGGLKAVRVSAEGESRHAKHAMLV